MSRRNLLAVARTALFHAETGEPVDMSAAKPNSKFFVVTDEMRHPLPAKDIAETIATAVKENIAMLEPETGITDKFRAGLETHRQAIAAEIEKIRGEQSDANAAHEAHLQRIADEKREAEMIHAELTTANDARIADAERTLAGINAGIMATNLPGEAAATPETKPTTPSRPRVVKEVPLSGKAHGDD